MIRDCHDRRFMTVPYLRYALLAGSVPIRRGKGTNEKTRKESRMGEEEEAAAADFYGGALTLPGEGDLHPDRRQRMYA